MTFKEKIDKVLQEICGCSGWELSSVESKKEHKKAIDQIIELVKKEIIEYESLPEFKGKIECNCPCPGPQCSSLTHPCNQPEKHYLMSEAAVVNIRNEVRQEQRERIEK